VVKSNTAAPSTKPTSQELKQRLADAEINLAGLKNQIKDEKTAKRKLYSSLVKLATELKRMKNESQPLMDAAAFAHRGWYEGGMWRAPAILPGVFNQQVRSILREGLSHLFFNLVIVTAFTRVGMAIAQTGGITWDSILYYSVFWAIWTKDLNYTTRFDSTDLSFEFANLLTCIAVLWGSLSTTAPVASSESSRIMVVAGFVALMHLILHLRVAVWFHNAAWNSVEDRAKKHAYFSIATTVFETATWTAGVFLPSQYDSKRWIIFVIGICFSISRLPHNFLDNDFNGKFKLCGWMAYHVLCHDKFLWELTRPALSDRQPLPQREESCSFSFWDSYFSLSLSWPVHSLRTKTHLGSSMDSSLVAVSCSTASSSYTVMTPQN
jgi:hypothetical protein